jgi:hypothetical protein
MRCLPKSYDLAGCESSSPITPNHVVFLTSQSTPLDWSLVEIAALVSESIYIKTLQEHPQYDCKILKGIGGMKPTIVRVAEWNGERVLVVGIRGTVTRSDWALDLNSGPSAWNTVSMIQE